MEKLVYVDRRNTNCNKWDGQQKMFGEEGLHAMWVADMDFRVPECVVSALREYVESGVYGYYKIPDAYYQAFIDWEREHHGYEVKKDWIRFSPGVVAGFHWLLQILTEEKEGKLVPSPIAKEYQRQLVEIMIDEYQDTNHVQYLLAKLISAPENNLCAVGDIDQSIYGWRGADISNILDFEKDYPDAKIYKLEQNYRSTQVILDAANAVIEHNSARRPKNLWTENGNGKPITYFQAFNDRNEAEFTVHNMRRLRDEAHFHLGDMAVLYRTNAQSRMF